MELRLRNVAFWASLPRRRGPTLGLTGGPSPAEAEGQPHLWRWVNPNRVCPIAGRPWGPWPGAPSAGPACRREEVLSSASETTQVPAEAAPRSIAPSGPAAPGRGSCPGEARDRAPVPRERLCSGPSGGSGPGSGGEQRGAPPSSGPPSEQAPPAAQASGAGGRRPRLPHPAARRGRALRGRSRRPKGAPGGWPHPPLNYCLLISLALSSSADGSLAVQEIYRFARHHFPFFRTAPEGWKNTIRHNLCFSSSFQKTTEFVCLEGNRKSRLWKLTSEGHRKLEGEVQALSEDQMGLVRQSMDNPGLMRSLFGL